MEQDPNDARSLAELFSSFDLPTNLNSSTSLQFLNSLTNSNSTNTQANHQLSFLDSTIQSQKVVNESTPNSNNLSTSNTSSNQLQWNPQPTRSGRIPQKPDPKSNLFNPLDYLDFPTDSESDDPDFQPPLEDTTSAKQVLDLLDERPSGSQTAASASTPAIDWAQQLLGASGLSTADLLGHFGRYSAMENQNTSVSRSRPADSHRANVDPDLRLDTSTSSNNRDPKPNSKAIQLDPPSSRPNSRSPWPTEQIPSVPVPSHSSRIINKPSPLTAASMAGIPFVKIDFPDSDDSPEFVPPPPKRARREPGTSRTIHDSRYQSERELSRSPTRSFRNPATSSLRSIQPAIAKTPTDRPVEYITDGSPCESLAESDYTTTHHHHHQSSSSVPVLNKNGLPRAKPGPKPRPKAPLGSDEKAEFMQRKREGMRAVRARKKEYIEELEDQCRLLQAENIRLREENEQLMRESRENWKAKALGSFPSNPTNNHHLTTLKENNSHHLSSSRKYKPIAPKLTEGRTVLDVIAKRSKTTQLSRRL
ncbi:uncharacterized protein MELLADRAFT_115337 [Melampsora larici-populina 98AG31]|uniref:BZIP domain-containing protein n=1 Tax=Melampsora larici-populina (strain 98AG31 / pathotype 3-4-7) TaxID=747676 RepID=F4R964_MELLP|nr:uncharacterized protein MELLADRAFT_115337 [Melampsora larici-populina 98AG31]EGG11206.1 hypothetical protein MELLADRAFT_115337 [Melampsora larici-populina 98AG31]